MNNPKHPSNLLAELQIEAEAGLLRGIRNVPAEVYHDQRCPGLSRSAILELLKSPKHYRNWLENPPKPTASMEFGVAVHAALLEPDYFLSKFTHLPKDDLYKGQSKLAKEARATFELENADQKILDIEDFEAVLKIRENVYRCPEAIDLLIGEKEKTVFWQEPSTKLLCKVRPDVIQSGGRLVDLKTTSDGSFEAFKRSAAQLNYHIQAALYLDALRFQSFVFLCVENKEPYDVSIYELDSDSLDLGRVMIRRALTSYKNSLELKEWNGYSKKIQSMRLPQWKFYEEGSEFL